MVVVGLVLFCLATLTRGTANRHLYFNDSGDTSCLLSFMAKTMR